MNEQINFEIQIEIKKCIRTRWLQQSEYEYQTGPHFVYLCWIFEYKCQ